MAFHTTTHNEILNVSNQKKHRNKQREQKNNYLARPSLSSPYPYWDQQLHIKKKKQLSYFVSAPYTEATLHLLYLNGLICSIDRAFLSVFLFVLFLNTVFMHFLKTRMIRVNVFFFKLRRDCCMFSTSLTSTTSNHQSAVYSAPNFQM